jgi:hypothetical protein
MQIKRRVKKVKKAYNLAVTANRLTSGVVVYFTGTGWTDLLHQAKLSLEGDDLMSQAEKYTKNEGFVALELIKIDKLYNQFSPISAREKIRAAGPTISYN